VKLDNLCWEGFYWFTGKDTLKKKKKKGKEKEKKRKKVMLKASQSFHS